MIQANKQTGMTLIEVMITLTIATILISATSPSLMTMVQNNRMVSMHNDLLSDLALTRSSAVTQGSNATLCASNASGSQCLSNNTTWEYGWLVFNDPDNDAIIDNDETIIVARNNLSKQLQLVSSSHRVSFNTEGSALGFASEFAFCDSRGDSSKKGLIVSNSGRSRVAKINEIAVTCP
ncbi:MAG: GspH/FimT family pseudopilin [Leucothrix sp.]